MLRFLLGAAHWAGTLTLLVVGYVLTFMAHVSTPGMVDVGVAFLAAGVLFNPLVLRLYPFRQYPTRLIVAFFAVVLTVAWAHWRRG